MKFEVTAVIHGRKVIEVESEEQIIEIAAEMGFDDFNWDDLQLADIKELGARVDYSHRIITGKVKDTGLAIDGYVLALSLWDYDKNNYHLFSWADESDEAVMKTMYQTEQEAGLCQYDSLEEFAAAWKAKEWEADGVFCIPLENVELLEVVQEEQKDGE